jgi:hypothetical protein
MCKGGYKTSYTPMIIASLAVTALVSAMVTVGYVL